MTVRTILSVALLLVYAAAARAEFGVPDPVPAATLLLPYFEVGLGDESDVVNTTFSIRNFGPAPVLAHVMIFTDLSVGTVAFDHVLPGFGSETFDLGAIFRNEASASLALSRDTPVETPPPAPVSSVFSDSFETGDIGRWSRIEARASEQTMAAYHTGETSDRTGLCAGAETFDGRARGYVLIDATSDFAGDVFPETDGYFAAGGTGIAANDNVLWGEFELRRPENNFAFGERLMAIEAEDTKANPAKGAGPTFYARYVNGDGRDGRETLNTSWGARYLLGGAFSATSAMYWRDPEIAQQPFFCGTPPAWLPLEINEIIVFNEDADGVVLAETEAFPRVCGLVGVGFAGLSTPFDFGWMYVDFGAVSTQGGPENQAVLLTSYDSQIGFSLGQYGAPFDDVADILIKIR